MALPIGLAAMVVCRLRTTSAGGREAAGVLGASGRRGAVTTRRPATSLHQMQGLVHA